MPAGVTGLTLIRWLLVCLRLSCPERLRLSALHLLAYSLLRSCSIVRKESLSSIVLTLGGMNRCSRRMI